MMSERSKSLDMDTAKAGSGREAVAAAVAVAIEAVVVLFSFSGDVPLSVPMQLHAAAVAVVALLLFRGREPEDDLTLASLMFLVILVAGPAGAIASLAALAFVNHAGAGPEVLSAWYTRLSKASGSIPSTELSDRVVAGRVIDTNSAAPAQFENVIASGTLEERQAALGLMARHFHTDYAPALEAALRSPEPVVRVQAAAVVSRVRADLKTRIKALLLTNQKRGSVQSLNDAAELVRLAACSLVDRADAEKCRKGALETLQKVLSTRHDVLSLAAAARRETAPLIESYLVSAGRYRDFRVSRRVHTLVLNARYRVRPINNRPSKRRAAA
jgi:polysaccharide biosynthesis protein PelE